VALNNQGDFDGLPEGLRSSDGSGQREEFECAGVIGNTRSFVEPFLTLAMTGNYTKFGACMSKGDNEKDNKATLVQILQLRAKAKFWFPYFRTLEPEQ
jgi:hypothetical protein